MGLFKKLLGAKETEQLPAITTEPNTVYAPFTGQVIDLAQINDGVFSAGVLGQGVGMIPAEETVYAPFDGTIVQIADTKHAIGILSNDNIELLIHVGMDTVSMNGDGFHVHVSAGDTVTCGQKLLTFSREKIAACGYPDTTAIVITNSGEFTKITPLTTGTVTHQDKLLLVK